MHLLHNSLDGLKLYMHSRLATVSELLGVLESNEAFSADDTTSEKNFLLNSGTYRNHRMTKHIGSEMMKDCGASSFYSSAMKLVSSGVSEDD